jgi:hypothetical protein
MMYLCWNPLIKFLPTFQKLWIISSSTSIGASCFRFGASLSLCKSVILFSFPNPLNTSPTGNVKGKHGWQSYLVEASTLLSSLFWLIGKSHHVTRAEAGVHLILVGTYQLTNQLTYSTWLLRTLGKLEFKGKETQEASQRGSVNLSPITKRRWANTFLTWFRIELLVWRNSRNCAESVLVEFGIS